jgi:hypothetical protein
MTHRAAHEKAGRHGFSLRTGVRGTLHSWAALTCLIELHDEGINGWTLTLPVVIIALLDAWHEFRITSRTSDNISGSHNHPKKPPDDDRSEECFPFPPPPETGNTKGHSAQWCPHRRHPK